MIDQQVTYLSDLHFNHNQWSAELEFMEDELRYFEGKLAEIIGKSTDKEVLAKSEHFQNVFRLHQEKIDILNNSIHRHEGKLAQLAKANPSQVESMIFNNHSGIREKLDVERKLFREIKDDYFQFLSKYM